MALLHDTTLRCKGWCQEEQTLLQVRATGCSSTTLGIGPHLSLSPLVRRLSLLVHSHTE